MKSWIQKLQQEKQPEVKKIDFAFADIPANSVMLIATPKIIADYIKQIPRGNAVNLSTLRNDLAKQFYAEYTCPLTTGMFLRIVAEAAYEQYMQGKAIKNITPFWRVIEPNTRLAKKLTFGQEFLIEQRKKEHIDGIKAKK